MPSGSGKSLLYQLPAMMDYGFSLVITPINSLIQDQARGLKNLKINVAFSTTESESSAMY